MTHLFDIFQDLQKSVRVRITARQTQGRSSLGSKQLRRHQEQPIANRLQVERLPIGRQAEALEPIDQVVGQKDQMEVGLVGGPISGGDLAQGVSFQELSNDQLPRGPLVVESPEVQGLQGEVGDDHLIGISGHLKERKLPGWLLGDQTSDHDETLGPFPAPGLVCELRQPDPRRDLLVSKIPEGSLNRAGNPGHDGIARRNCLEVFGQGMIVEGRIGPDPNPSNAGR